MQETKNVSSWENWNPRDYLKDYYTEVEPDELVTIDFLARTFRGIKGSPVALEFGSGPTLHHAIPLAPYVPELHMADYLAPNIDEVKKWVNKDQSRHSWDNFTRYTLQCEGIEDPTAQQIVEREDLTRGKITRFFQADQSDAGNPNPIGAEARGSYSLVMSCYCADSATDDRETWERYMRNIASLTAPDGFFVTAALREANYYTVGERSFPSAYVDEDSLRRVLELDFYPESITIEVKDIPEHESQGYRGILLAHAVKKA